MYKFILLFLILFSTSFPQTKYLIYFKDKGINKNTVLSKNSNIYKEALGSLSERSILRRKKTMGNNFITFEDLPIKNDYIIQLVNSGIKIDKKLKWFNAVSAYLDDNQKSEILSFPFIEKIEPVKILWYKRLKDNPVYPSIKKNSITADLDYGPSFTQDNLIDIPKVQSKGITGQGIIIGLLDSGFRWRKHESLMDRHVIAEHDFVFNDDTTANQSGDISGQDSHGTGVFSIIGGFKDGEIIGPAYNASFILAKTEDERSETHVEEDNYASALMWMDSIGVDITSSSLGYSEFDKSTYSYTYEDMDGKTTIVTKAAEMAFQRGILTITAAGNEGNQKWHYITAPADGFNTIAVGAVDNQNKIASFSSVGPSFDGRIKPDVVAQGVSVYHADVVNASAYSSGGGTSYATPLTAGTAALLLSANPYLTNVQARDILQRTADSYFKPDNIRGYGLISGANAVSFPNIESLTNGYKLHKIFISNNRIIPGSVTLNYLTDVTGLTTIKMDYDGTLKYSTTLPSLSTGTKLKFYFTFFDSSGNLFREPVNTYYSYNYGEMEITASIDTSTSAVPGNFILAQNYPNPFNNRTVILFNSELNSNAKLIIYNSLGEKVKMLFNGITNQKQNSIIWDGTNDLGQQSASGIYFYTLILDGKYYNKKMVYLK